MGVTDSRGGPERYAHTMPEPPTRTVYVQQQQVLRDWQDHAETDDRAIAMGRYKVFAREKGTR